MTETFLNGKVTLHPGDCLEVLQSLPENSIDSVVCDPPYHLHSIVKRFAKTGRTESTASKSGPHNRTAKGFMGRTWDGGDVAFQVETWAHVLRVLKPGGYLLAFSSCRTFGRMQVAIEDAGFITHPFIAWIFGSGFPKAHRVADPEWDGWRYGGQALKPAIEPIYMGQKPFSEVNGTLNVQRWGTGAINVDGCRVGVDVTGQRPYEIEAWEQEQFLCASCAALAEKTPKPATPATRASTAPKPVEPTSSERGRPSLRDTDRPDIGCSGGTTAGATSTNLNTSKSGNTPTDPCRPDLKSTTGTKIEGITTSTICSSCQKPITGHSTNENTTPATKSLRLDGSKPAPIGRDGEPSAHRRYSESGSTDFAATPGPRGGSPSGRWPANLIHDGSDEVLEAFPDAPGQQRAVTGTEQSHVTNNCYGHFERGGSGAVPRGDVGSAARFFYTAKADADDRCGSKHPTVKPLDLMQYLVRLVTPKGGTVLDPFAGTGTTGEAAWREGFRAVLIEREAEYQDDIARRMKLALAGPEERRRALATPAPVEDTPLFTSIGQAANAVVGNLRDRMGDDDAS